MRQAFCKPPGCLALICVATILSTIVHANEPISFQLDVQPILTSTGCNSGGCHGKQRGQNGFQLSLLGFDSDFDYAAITKESRGRRIFPASPEKSLLLQKATGALPHGGGQRIDPNTDEYRVLVEWLQQGNVREIQNEKKLIRVSLNHTERLLAANESSQLNVTAHYDDESTRDVTDQATYQSNDAAIVSVDEAGKMMAGEIPGETAIMARYMYNIEVCHVAIPLAKKLDSVAYESLPKNNFIDELVWKKLNRLNILPSDTIDDAKFMRRVYTDIIGRIPTSEEAKRFLESKEESKRTDLVDQLLEMPEYAEFAANKWADLLRTNPYRVGIKTTLNYDRWIRQQFRENVPYDQFAKTLISAKGSTFRNGAVTMFRDRRSPDELTTIVTQLFLGIRLECAKCHHHPFEKWSQEDFYSFAAFFKNVSRKGTGLSPPISGSEEIVLETGNGTVKHPATGKVLSPSPLFGTAESMTEPGGYDALQTGESPVTLRESLANWIASEENEYFAKVQVNRVWADLMGRGIVEPVDDLRATNPPSNSELLNALANDFVKSGFDQKHLIRTICNSYVYSLSSTPNEKNISDRLNYSRHFRHRLRAETLLDSLSQITGVKPSFDAAPNGARATEIWTHRTGSLFLDTFGRPNPNEDPPCIRSSEFTVTQSLHLMNAREFHSQLISDSGNAARLSKSELSNEAIVNEIYLMIYSRLPSSDEQEFASAIVAGENDKSPQKETDVKQTQTAKKKNRSKTSRRKRIEDLMWAMINTPEFSIQD